MKEFNNYVEFIYVEEDIKSIDHLFHVVAQDAYDNGFISSVEGFIEDIERREKEMSTEIAEGIGMPHTKSHHVTEIFVAICISSKGIKYSNGRKVNIVFLIGAPYDSKEYIHVMASVARLLSKKNVKDKLLSAENSHRVREILEECCISTKAEEKKGVMVVLILNKERDRQKVSEILISSGVSVPTILDSIYGIREFAGRFPFFARLTMMDDYSETSMMFIGFCDDKDCLHKIYHSLKEEDVDLSKEGEGILMGIDVFMAIGGKDEDTEI